jgi:hypothetical protein
MAATMNRFARRLLAKADRCTRRGTPIPAGVSARLGQLGIPVGGQATRSQIGHGARSSLCEHVR